MAACGVQPSCQSVPSRSPTMPLFVSDRLSAPNAATFSKSRSCGSCTWKVRDRNGSGRVVHSFCDTNRTSSPRARSWRPRSWVTVPNPVGAMSPRNRTRTTTAASQDPLEHLPDLLGLRVKVHDLGEPRGHRPTHPLVELVVLNEAADERHRLRVAVGLDIERRLPFDPERAAQLVGVVGAGPDEGFATGREVVEDMTVAVRPRLAVQSHAGLPHERSQLGRGRDVAAPVIVDRTDVAVVAEAHVREGAGES